MEDTENEKFFIETVLSYKCLHEPEQRQSSWRQRAMIRFATKRE